jgi:hypothetical protein
LIPCKSVKFFTWKTMKLPTNKGEHYIVKKNTVTIKQAVPVKRHRPQVLK